MRRSTKWIVALAIGAAAMPSIADTERPTLASDRFVLEQVAGPPLVHYPMAAAFDEQGRLYVAESSGQNLSADELAVSPPHRILRLEDVDGDGVFDRSTTFADAMAFPAGVACIGDAVYVASFSGVWRLRDTNGDGVADERRELVSGFGSAGIADDLHGPFEGPFGRLWWHDGVGGGKVDALEFPDGTKRSAVGAGLYRMQADGSKFERFAAGGMNNPVELVFSPAGEPLASVNLFAVSPRIDGVMHWTEAGLYPHQQAAVAGLPSSGDHLPLAVPLGHLAVSGLARDRAGLFGDAGAIELLISEFNTHRVRRVSLRRKGASFEAHAVADLISSDDENFHPTDVLQDADGSLLVVDTGGWFVAGCPTSRIARPQFYGGIWRIREAKGKRADDPRGASIRFDALDADALATLLSDARFAVRDRAVTELARRGEDAVAALGSAHAWPKPESQLAASFVLGRIGSPASLQLLRRFMVADDPEVRIAAVEAIGLHRDRGSAEQLRRALTDRHPAVRRSAATALGRAADRTAVAGMLEALPAAEGDAVLEHALVMGLIRIGEVAALEAGLQSDKSAIVRGAMVALEQVGGRIDDEAILRGLDSGDTRLRAAAVKHALQRPSLVDANLKRIAPWLLTKDSRRDIAIALLASAAGEEQVQLWVGSALAPFRGENPIHDGLFAVMRQTDREQFPIEWSLALANSLGFGDESMRRRAVEVVGAQRIAYYDDPLRFYAEDAEASAALRFAALQALAAHRGSCGDAAASWLIEQAASIEPLAALRAASLLGSLDLSADQQRRVAEAMGHLSPAVVSTLLPAMSLAADPAVGTPLLKSLAASPASAGLDPVVLHAMFASATEPLRSRALAWIDSLSRTGEQRAERIDQALAALDSGDAVVGRELFFTTAACGACHAVGGKGGVIGPDLSAIGSIRSRRDLVESILFPSAAIAQGYESFDVTLADGRHLRLRLVAFDEKQVRGIDAAGAEHQFERSMVTAAAPAGGSIMPAGLEGLLDGRKFADLLAYLASLR